MTSPLQGEDRQSDSAQAHMHIPISEIIARLKELATQEESVHSRVLLQTAIHSLEEYQKKNSQLI